jgi:hypothetical protein
MGGRGGLPGGLEGLRGLVGGLGGLGGLRIFRRVQSSNLTSWLLLEEKGLLGEMEGLSRL